VHLLRSAGSPHYVNAAISPRPSGGLLQPAFAPGQRADRNRK